MSASHSVTRFSAPRTFPGERWAESRRGIQVCQDPPDHLVRARWEVAIGEVKNHLHAQKCRVLLDVHSAVLAFIATMESSPEELRTEYEQVAAEVQEAMAHPESDFQNFEMATSKVAGWVRSQSQGESDPNSKYGGALGQAIFDAVIRKHTIPALAACLTRFFNDTNNLGYDERLDAVRAFLPGLLNVAAEGRRAVATMSSTANAQEFGAAPPVRDVGMHDVIGMDWKPWHDIVINKIFSVLTPHVASHLSSHPDQAFSEFLLSKPASLQDGRRVVEFVDGDETMSLSFDVTHGRSGAVILRAMPYSDQVSSYTFGWSTAADGRLIISDLVCVHPPAMAVDAVREIAPDVLSALAWDPEQGVDELKKSLATILHTFSHSSTFHRGQASIVEMILRSIALCHGLRLEFSPAWSRPNAQPDQHALAELHRHPFVAGAMDNLLFLGRA